MNKTGIAAWTVLALLLAGPSPSTAQDAPGKVFISSDLEGVSGVVAGSQTGSEGPDYQVFRSLLLGEVNAAVTAAFAAGASEVLVTDAHGSGRNLVPGRLDPRVELISGFPLPRGMMTGIDETFSAAILIGVHAHGSAPHAVLAHTYTNALKHVRLNGIEVGEFGLNAALAGHYGVPVVFVSGDQTAVEEARELVPNIEAVVVKEALGRTAARTRHPETTRAEIAEGVAAALARRDEIDPVELATPVTIEIELADTAQADAAMLVPGMERVSGRVVRYRAPDMAVAYQISMLIERVAWE